MKRMMHAIACMLLAGLALALPASIVFGQAQPSESNLDARKMIEELQSREKRIADLAGSYMVEQTVSSWYVDTYASARRVSKDSVRARYETRSQIDFALRSPSKIEARRLEERVFDGSGGKVAHRIFAFDGSEHYSMSGIPEGDDSRVATVVVGEETSVRFIQNCDLAILMGLCVPDYDAPLSVCASEFEGTFSGPVVRGDSQCVKLQFVCPESEKSPSARYSILLDQNRGLAIKFIELEYYSEERSEWMTMNHWDVKEFGRDDALGIWYPESVTGTQWLGEKEAITGTVLSLANIRFNQGLTMASFTPSIEDGSNVVDPLSGLVSVHGGRLSPRIKNHLKEQAEAARKEVAEALSAGHVRQVPNNEHGNYGWLLVVAGGVLLGIAVIWQRRLHGH